jgi:hypothetical protein
VVDQSGHVVPAARCGDLSATIPERSPQRSRKNQATCSGGQNRPCGSFSA